MKLLFIAFSFFSTLPLFSQSVLGTWKTVDDRDGIEKSYVDVYEIEGKIYGKVSKLLKESPDKRCDRCKGERKDQLLQGMVVIEGLSHINDHYGNGRIYDPVTGNDYGCSIWIEKDNPNELKVRGKHWSGIYRTQTWYRVM
ncbi:MAG: DUF2147 domain-containing protein [Saprospiraceae bacterium]